MGYWSDLDILGRWLPPHTLVVLCRADAIAGCVATLDIHVGTRPVEFPVRVIAG